jgi:septation ring formation regulator EzrA
LEAIARQVTEKEAHISSLVEEVKQLQQEAREAAARQAAEKDHLKSTLDSAIKRLRAQCEGVKQMETRHVKEMDTLTSREAYAIDDTQKALEEGRQERAALGGRIELLGLRLGLLQRRKRSLVDERKSS